MDEQRRLEAHIAGALDDTDAYLVYADWLLQHGDPRGQLIMLQHQGHEAAARAMLERHAGHFYGSLSARRELVDATWHLGFIRSCRFSLDADRGPGHGPRTRAALRALLALPSMRFLRELSLGVMSVPENSYGEAIELLAGHDLRSLERLALGEDVVHMRSADTEPLVTDVGMTRAIYTAAPNLRTLVLRSSDDDPDLEGLALRCLRELRVEGGGNGARLLGALSRARAPELESLAIASNFVVADAAWVPLLGGTLFRKLRHLALGVYSFLVERAGALIASAPVLRQLRSLDLSQTALGERDIDAILAGAAAFAHLERLELGLLLCSLGSEKAAALRTVCRDVTFKSLLSP